MPLVFVEGALVGVVEVRGQERGAGGLFSKTSRCMNRSVPMPGPYTGMAYARFANAATV